MITTNTKEKREGYAAGSLAKDVFILRQLVGKDFKLKYRRSVLGVAWSVLNPLLMMIVMSIVFSYMFRHNIENYPLYLILGNITFSFMSDSTKQGLNSIIGASSLLKKIKVDRFVFPVQKVLFALVNFAFSFIAVIVVMLWFRVLPTWHFILLPVCLALLALFCCGLGMILGAAAVFFRDVIHLWGVVITAWNYLTPVFWDFQMLIDNHAPGIVLAIVRLNPMYNYVQFMRDIVLWQTVPTTATLCLCIFWALAALALGVFVFKRSEHKFILYI